MKKEKLTLYDLFFIFLFGCFFGWLIEGIWTLIKKNVFINHSAFVIGPINLVYGVGAIVLTLMLYKIRNSNYIKIFMTSFITGSVLEYAMSLIMEYFVGFVAWNYSSKPLNINGRICLLFSIFWGVLGIVWIKLIYPRLKKSIARIPVLEGIQIIKFMTIFLFLDCLLSFAAVHRGKEFDKGVSPNNWIEEKLDQYFGVNYLNNMFNNRWNR